MLSFEPMPFKSGQRADSLGPVGLPEVCRGQTERRFTLSDDPRLLDQRLIEELAAAWSRQGQAAHARSEEPRQRPNPG